MKFSYVGYLEEQIACVVTSVILVSDSALPTQSAANNYFPLPHITSLEMFDHLSNKVPSDDINIGKLSYKN
jgi:hypothetical protein